MSPMNRRNFISASAAALLAGSSRAEVTAGSVRQDKPAVATGASRPNLVIFMPDELRADVLGCYGDPLTKSPNFNKLAAQGTRFDQCRVALPICGASRCSMLTGWPVSVRGHRSQMYFLRPDEPNMFRDLRRAGYDVYWFGKNDALAAESFPGSVTAWNYLDGKSYPGAGGGKGGGGQNTLPFIRSKLTVGDRRATPDYESLTGGIKLLERTQSDKPFCLFLPLGSPHPPYNAPDGFAGLHPVSSVGPLLPPDLPRRPQYMQQMRAAYGLDKKSETDFRTIRATYLDKVSYADWLLGELMEALERTHHVKDTTLMVVSDHGDYAGDYGLVEKWPSGMEDCMTHVPMIMRTPGGTAGHVVREQVELFDLMATSLELAGTKPQHTNFAQSLVPQLHGAAGDPQRASFTEGGYDTYEPQCFEPVPPLTADYYPRLHLEHEIPLSVARVAAVRTAGYNFVSRPTGDSEFYLLADDPLQKNNRFGDASVQAQQTEATTRLLHWYINTSGIAPTNFDSRDFPPYVPPQVAS